MSLTGFSGAAGIKYGLNVRGPNAKKPGLAAPRPTLAAFAAPSDDEGEDDDGGDGRAGANAQIARQQQRARDSQKVRTAQQRARNPTADAELSCGAGARAIRRSVGAGRERIRLRRRV